MDNNQVVKVLYNLAQLDIDATYAYEQALKQIDDKTIYVQIDKFRADHVRHIDNLDAFIRKYGGTPPEFTKDFKGYLIEGFTSLRSITGTRGALNAMETNEILTNRNYRKAIEDNPNLPADALALLQSNFGDEKHHLEYIRQALKVAENA